MARRASETTAAELAAETTAEARAQDPTVEEHANVLEVPAWQLEGLKRLKRWGEGKRVPAAEFAGELNRFLNGRMDQRRARG